MRFWPQHEHQTVYAISLLKHDVVVLRKYQGPQKWLAPCRTDVHRVARTIDVSILEKESHRQNNTIMRNEVLIEQNMENLVAKSVCLLEQLRPLLRTWPFVTYYCMNAQAGAKVLAVEKDYVLAKSLSEDMAEEKSLAVEQGDVLRISFEDTIKKLRGMAGMATPPSRIKVVANLPYNITTDILKRLLPLGEDIASIVFMLQHEVAERLSNSHPSALRYFGQCIVASLRSAGILRFEL
jgi:hypothetical protein